MSKRKPVGKLMDLSLWNAMKAVGYSEEELLAEQPWGPIISSYSRAQAMEDGVLVDVTDLARDHGFKINTAITCALWAELKSDPARVVGLLRILLQTIRRVPANRDTDQVHFKVGELEVWSLIGPGDEGEPVLTIMLEGED